MSINFEELSYVGTSFYLEEHIEIIYLNENTENRRVLQPQKQLNGLTL